MIIRCHWHPHVVIPQRLNCEPAINMSRRIVIINTRSLFRKNANSPPRCSEHCRRGSKRRKRLASILSEKEVIDSETNHEIVDTLTHRLRLPFLRLFGGWRIYRQPSSLSASPPVRWSWLRGSCSHTCKIPVQGLSQTRNKRKNNTERKESYLKFHVEPNDFLHGSVEVVTIKTKIASDVKHVFWGLILQHSIRNKPELKWKHIRRKVSLAWFLTCSLFRTCWILVSFDT